MSNPAIEALQLALEPEAVRFTAREDLQASLSAAISLRRIAIAAERIAGCEHRGYFETKSYNADD